ncbi:MAG TPA: sensor histidine kinase [Anaerolineaceae bacterium]|nr:sensor histidine kinase [Anaerolineaceae bacterium]
MLTWLRELKKKSGEGTAQALPFFVLLTLALLGLSVWTLLTTETLRGNLPLAAGFIILALTHIALHTLSPYIIFAGQRVVLVYLSIQGALAFVLAVITGQTGFSYALFLALIGEAVSILRPARLAIVAVSVYLALSALTAFVYPGNTPLLDWVVGTIPTTVFVVVYVRLYTQQAEARNRVQNLLGELETAHRQLAEYTTRIEDLTLANERQRMARELHDTLAQGLAGLILQLEAVDSHLSSGRSERAQAIVNQAMDRARETLKDARRVIDDLRSGDADMPDLAEPVRHEVERFCAASGIECELAMNLPAGIPEGVREHVLRAVREGLTNIARHAQARRVQVRLSQQDGRLVVEIIDDGLGFDPALVGQPGHYGLVGMRERARLAGGLLEITSQPQQGTRLRMTIPMEVQA